jgi:alpha-D-xyloside xylohydrolase
MIMTFPLEPNWHRVPPVRLTGDVAVTPHGFEVETDVGPLKVTALSAAIRVTLGRPTPITYPILVTEPTPVAADVAVEADRVVVRAGDLSLTVERDPFSFVLAHGDRVIQQSPGDGHFVRRFRLPPFARTEDGWIATFDLKANEPVYGLGEKWGRLNKRGELVRSEVFDALGVNADRAYKNAPFAWSPRGWGLFVHTPATVWHSVGAPLWSQRAYGVLVKDAALDLFLIAGDTPARLLDAYTGLTGKAPTPPLWSLGVILSKAYYRTADEILEAARGVRARGLPCDTITFDGRAWQDTPTRFHFAFDETRYGDPKAVIDELKAMGFKICVWEYPLVAFAGRHFQELADKGYLIKDQRTGEPYRYRFDPEPFGQVLTQLPDSALLDFTNPDAYRWWRDAHKPLFELGVDMIKSDFGEQIEPECIAFNGDTGDRLHNIYPLLYNQCVYEAAELYCPSGAFLFGRAGWAGSQRYPVQWGGDPQADWGGLAASIRGAQSWGLSGGPYHATDIGGFYKDTRDPELYARWTQVAIFASHIRFHGIGEREPWAYGAEAEAAVRAALDWRLRLTPYLWAAVEEATRTGLPVQRAMALACPDDPAAWAFETQFFCGPDILAAPIVEPGGAVTVYLPAGRWWPLDGGAAIEGGRVVSLSLSLDRFAAFVRDGATVPLGPLVDRLASFGDAPEVVEQRRYG